MTPWMRMLHKWVGLIIGLQLVIWTGSGVLMSLLDTAKVNNLHHLAAKPSPQPWPEAAIAPSIIVARDDRSIQSVETHWLAGKPVYRLTDGISTWLASTRDGRAVPVTAPDVLTVATADYVGDGQAAAPELIKDAMWEVRDHAGPIWRVNFSDADGTTVYVSGQDGRVLERRNDTWRIFDFAMMLHFMDYTRQQNFNNPLIVTVGAGGLWIALSGIWLLVVSFRLSEFIPARWKPLRELEVFGADGNKLSLVQSRAGDTVYVALARNGLQLPSNCGGGQSCGLCVVRVRGQAPTPTSADRQHIDESRLGLGYRLACDLPVASDAQIEVAGGAALWTELAGTVVAVNAVTPFLRELTIAPDHALGSEFRPGAYLQIHVPSYSLKPNDLQYPEHHRPDWSGLGIPPTLVCKEPVRRSYSLSLPVEQADGNVTLLVRFSPGRNEKKRQPVGKGSTYMYSLKPGDRVRFSGPFGDFAVRPGIQEKVFIGGGAGMAPLRSMIHSLLASGAQQRIHFWYGARNMREAPYVDEMEGLAKTHANFTWHLVLSEPDQPAANGASGLVHDAVNDGLLQGHPDPDRCEYYVCGPPAMLAATRELLRQLGVASEKVAYDDFKI